MNTFFDNLVTFTKQKLELFNSLTNSISNQQHETTDQNDLVNHIRLHIQSRLQFLSFIYSSLGSPRDFQLTRQHVEVLWDCLVQFNDPSDSTGLISIRDDLFNWFLTQAKVKDQHAISIETFNYIFTDKITQLDPNNFSQTALHLYQELFKIYKYSYQQQQSQSTSIESSHFKQIELAAIEYIWKLAFKSSNRDVSLAAVQFLNSHYVQVDTIASTDSEVQFIGHCMGYLNEACDKLKIEKSDFEQCFCVIERGLLLLRSHLDAFQARNSFQLRRWQISKTDPVDDDDDNDDNDDNDDDVTEKDADEVIFESHAKRLEQVRIANNEAFDLLFRRLNSVVDNLIVKPANIENKKTIKNK